MLRAYSRRIVELINQTREVRTFIPGARLHLRDEPHRSGGGARGTRGGESKYSFYQLLRLNFDLMTGFSWCRCRCFRCLACWWPSARR